MVQAVSVTSSDKLHRNFKHRQTSLLKIVNQFAPCNPQADYRIIITYNLLDNLFVLMSYKVTKSGNQI